MCFKRTGMVSIHTLKVNYYKIIERNFYFKWVPPPGFLFEISISIQMFLVFRTIFCEFKPGVDRHLTRFL